MTTEKVFFRLGTDHLDVVTINVSNGQFDASDFRLAVVAYRTVGCRPGDLQIFMKVNGKRKRVVDGTIPVNAATNGKHLIVCDPTRGQLNHSLMLFNQSINQSNQPGLQSTVDRSNASISQV